MNHSRPALRSLTLAALYLAGSSGNGGGESATTLSIHSTPVAEANYPFVVKLYATGGGNPICAGIAVRDRWVLTAAHCVREPNPLATTLAAATEPFTAAREFEKYCHPDYVKGDSADDLHDVALLHLKSDVDPLPQPKFDPVAVRPLAANERLVSFGWGMPSLGVFKRTQPMPAVTPAACGPPRFLHQVVQSMNEVCAGSSASTPCKGDSGGPLFTVTKIGSVWKEQALMGVVSQADCSSVGGPAIFAGLSASDKTDWFDQVITADNTTVKAASAAACNQ